MSGPERVCRVFRKVCRSFFLQATPRSATLVDRRFSPDSYFFFVACGQPKLASCGGLCKDIVDKADKPFYN